MDATFIFLSVLVNRITELLKRALTNQFPALKEDTVSLIVLFISFVVGAAGVILIFPSSNIFAGRGTSLFSELVATGIVIGGLANGLDFLGGALGGLVDKVTTPTISKEAVSAKFSVTAESSDKVALPPAA